MKIADPKNSGFGQYDGFYNSYDDEHLRNMDEALNGMYSAKLTFGTNNHLRVVGYVGTYQVVRIYGGMPGKAR
jgi:hypothetical protein